MKKIICSILFVIIILSINVLSYADENIIVDLEIVENNKIKGTINYEGNTFNIFYGIEEGDIELEEAKKLENYRLMYILDDNYQLKKGEFINKETGIPEYSMTAEEMVNSGNLDPNDLDWSYVKDMKNSDFNMNMDIDFSGFLNFGTDSNKPNVDVSISANSTNNNVVTSTQNNQFEEINKKYESNDKIPYTGIEVNWKIIVISILLVGVGRITFTKRK